MQWGPDRNAGFSEASGERLYLPLITDPVYHFEAVNVAVQEADPGSLLWWMKRAIGLRRRHPSLARGTFAVVPTPNRHVIAYRREHRGETILVVANLSRYAQRCELDLAGDAGRGVTELFGGGRLPRDYRRAVRPHPQTPFVSLAPPRDGRRPRRPGPRAWFRRMTAPRRAVPRPVPAAARRWPAPSPGGWPATRSIDGREPSSRRHALRVLRPRGPRPPRRAHPRARGDAIERDDHGPAPHGGRGRFRRGGRPVGRGHRAAARARRGSGSRRPPRRLGRPGDRSVARSARRRQARRGRPGDGAPGPSVRSPPERAAPPRWGERGADHAPAGACRRGSPSRDRRGPRAPGRRGARGAGHRVAGGSRRGAFRGRRPRDRGTRGRRHDLRRRGRGLARPPSRRGGLRGRRGPSRPVRVERARRDGDRQPGRLRGRQACRDSRGGPAGRGQPGRPARRSGATDRTRPGAVH